MEKRDQSAFFALIDGAYEMHFKALSPKAKALFFASLEHYELSEISAGLSEHVRDPVNGRFPPQPAHIVAKIEFLRSGSTADRAGSDEAWAIALASRNEADTVVWTTEMQEAFAVCRPVLDAGDEVGARMAFKDAYNRLVDAAKRKGAVPKWEISLGWDQDKRDKAVAEASASGRLALPASHPLMLTHDHAGDSGEISVEGRERVRQLLEELKNGWSRKDEERARKIEAERHAFDDLKRKNDVRVAEYLENGGAS